MSHIEKDHIMSATDKKDLTVISSTREIALAVWRDAKEILKNDIAKLRRADLSIQLKDGMFIRFIPDKEELIRGRRGIVIWDYAFSKILGKYEVTGKFIPEE